MSRALKSFASIAAMVFFTIDAVAQEPATPKQVVKRRAAAQKTPASLTTKELSAQIESLQSRLDQAQSQIQQQNAQIERLHQSLQESVNALQQQQQELQASVQKANEHALMARDTAAHVGMEVTAVQNSVVSAHESLQTQERRVKSLEEPTTIRYKGLTITPGGFLEATALVRARNENSDIADAFNIIPLNGSSNSKLSEFRGSARHSRLSLMLQGNSGSTHLTGYYEMDFLGASPTSNYGETGSFTPRVRQAWAEIGWDSGWTITAGQMWTLLTTNRHGIANKAEFIPETVDANYVAGFTWLRNRAVRVTKNFHDKIWTAFEVDSPENAYSAAYVPPNVMGLNTSANTQTGLLLLPYLENYSFGTSTTVAPDLLAKVAFEPGWGHFEIKAVGRFFRDRIASIGTNAGHTNLTMGYGIGFSAIMPVQKKVDVIGEGLMGQGIGRYGSSQFADVTLNPISGEMRPLREAHLLGGIEYHPNNRLKLYTYAGDEYAGRYAYVSPTGTAAGYGSPLVSYAGCWASEVSMNSCGGANRNITDFTVGYWYRLYQGEFGWVQYGNQVVYMNRSLWNGQGRMPQGQDLVLFSSVRFYFP